MNHLCDEILCLITSFNELQLFQFIKHFILDLLFNFLILILGIMNVPYKDLSDAANVHNLLYQSSSTLNKFAFSDILFSYLEDASLRGIHFYFKYLNSSIPVCSHHPSNFIFTIF